MLVDMHEFNYVLSGYDLEHIDCSEYLRCSSTLSYRHYYIFP